MDLFCNIKIDYFHIWILLITRALNSTYISDSRKIPVINNSED